MADYLNYRGDKTAWPAQCHFPMGPDTAGGWWIPVDAVYDPATDMTRVRCQSGALQALVERLKARHAQPQVMGALERFRRPSG